LNRKGAKDAKIYVFLPNRDGRFDKAIGPAGILCSDDLCQLIQYFADGYNGGRWSK